MVKLLLWFGAAHAAALAETNLSRGHAGVNTFWN
tara:strand:+ start:1011 stop:1112 length:102 start_codon:yes stop_codon:yes gene_type:complete